MNQNHALAFEEKTTLAQPTSCKSMCVCDGRNSSDSERKIFPQF